MARKQRQRQREQATVDYRDPSVELFANNLHNPSHMEWTADGRLLVSERGSGEIKDATEGGDMSEVEPFATGLEGPTRVQPTSDGRLLVVEYHAGRITDITGGGDVSGDEPFVEGLSKPYSLVEARLDGQRRLLVSEADGKGGRFRDVTGGGRAEDLPVVFDGFPHTQGHPGYTRLQEDWAEQWTGDAATECDNWLTADGERIFVSGSVKGEILDLTGAEPGQSYDDLVDDGRKIMTGRDRLGGLKYNADDDMVYGVEPGRGEVFVADPDETADHQFSPGIVRGLGTPSCLRFSDDNDQMFVCGLGHGVLWKVEDWR